MRQLTRKKFRFALGKNRVANNLQLLQHRISVFNGLIPFGYLILAYVHHQHAEIASQIRIVIVEEHIICQLAHTTQLLLLQIGNRMNRAIGFYYIKRAIPICHQESLMVVGNDMSYPRPAQSIERIQASNLLRFRIERKERPIRQTIDQAAHIRDFLRIGIGIMQCPPIHHACVVFRCERLIVLRKSCIR